MIEWQYKKFDELTNIELYEILKLRNTVFVVEQNCVYLDTDDKDLQAWHLSGYYQNQLVAYLRILPPGLSYNESSIGRVVTHPDFRNCGFGIELMKTGIVKTLGQFNADKIKISAQCYLLKFYSNLGFVAIGDDYLEDDIPHIEMIYNK
jgi:ElaA protein